jgi:hypothetical protein
MVESRLERAYQRLGPRYLERALFLQLQLVYGVIVVGVVVDLLEHQAARSSLARIQLSGGIRARPSSVR